MNSTFQIESNFNFPTACYGRLNVNGLSPELIDEMLESGWFRNSHQVYTTLGRFVENEWKPTLMLRLPLKGFEFKKSLRKLMNRNEKKFLVKIEPFAASDEMENLWQEYKHQVHNWSKVPNINQHLFRGLNPQVFQTQMVSVWFEDQLIAFSAFDKGIHSIASIEAAYDTRFSKHSLGIYTMLVEISYCIQNDLSYYYPGFIPRDTSMFDYKLRPGNLEFYRIQSNEWVPFSEKKSNDWLFDEVFRELRSVQHLLFSLNLKTTLRASNENSIPIGRIKSSDYNFMLVIQHGAEDGKDIIKIAFDVLMKKFLVFSKPSLSESRTSKSGNANELVFELNAEFIDKDSLLSWCKQNVL